MRKLFKNILKTILGLLIVGVLSMMFIFYGPFHGLRDLWVTSAMTTLNHKYLATWFFSDETIKQIMDSNKIIEPQESTDVSLIGVQTEEELLPKEEEIKRPDTIEYIDVSNGKYKGYLLKVSNPARVVVGTTDYLHKRGMKVDEIVNKYNAVGGINGGGFADEGGHGTGGDPTGIVVENYQIINSDNKKVHSVIGFDKNDILVLGKFTLEEIKAAGIRDAVDFGPFLIVNGQPAINEGNGGWGLAPRTAIGQTQDGTVLMLVIDGRQASSIGATLKEVQDIMLKHGAVNAANLDGGSSATLVYEGKIKNNPCSKYGPRYVPTAFIIKQ